MKSLVLALLAIPLLKGCNLIGKLQHNMTLNIKVPEASGLAMYNDTLYTISDRNGDIYRFTLDGERIDRLKTKTEDVEGITVVDNEIYLADEAKKAIHHYDMAGDRVSTINIQELKLYDPSSGLEGLHYDKYTDQFLLINEKNSGQLLQYDREWNLINQTYLGSYPDYAGITSTKDHIWIVSDEGSGIAQYDRDMKLVTLYDIPVDSPEGIVYDEARDLIYIVSDSAGEMYIFEIEGE